jgi:dipeptidyl aminopeptidase/acylaminoacyl peptidase
VIGDADLRVPPHQSYFYQHALQELGVETRLYDYPKSGHALLPTEHGMDALVNISNWFDKYLMQPWRESDEASYE